MSSTLSWLEAHTDLAGWAQFLGAMIALALTYFTAFMPIWHRKKQLKRAGLRLLSNGFEVLESYHRTTQNFLPVSLTLWGSAAAVGCIVDEIGRFPIYELDDQGSRSIARNLIAVNANLVATRLVFEDAAVRTQGRQATEQERDDLVEFLAERLALVRATLEGAPMERPVWNEVTPRGDEPKASRYRAAP